MKAKYKKVERIRIERGLRYKEIAKEMGLSTTGLFNVLSGLVNHPYATTEYKIDQWLAKQNQ